MLVWYSILPQMFFVGTTEFLIIQLRIIIYQMVFICTLLASISCIVALVGPFCKLRPTFNVSESMGFLFFATFTRSFILMKFDQKVVHSLFTRCIPCLLRTLTLSSNHALYSLSCRRLSSKFILYTGCTPCSLLFLLDIVLVPCGAFHITDGYLVFYMQGVFLAVCISVGVCPKIMWCTPCYRGISSCSNLCGQFIITVGF